MKTTLTATLQSMADSEVLSMVPDDVISRIRIFDSKPLFKVFSVGHEGQASPTILGSALSTPLQYFRSAIEKVSASISQGLAVFLNHAKGTNEHAGRARVGEVVSSVTKEIGDKLHSLATVYIYPEYKAAKLDVASIEAEVLYSQDAQGHAFVEGVQDITGIALGDADEVTPAFPGATLLGAIQAFQSQLTQHEGEKNMTIKEIQEAIKDGGHSPSDVFTVDALKADSNIVAHVKAEKQTEYEHARRVEKSLGEEREDRMKVEKGLNDELAKMKAANIKSKADSIVKGEMESRKFDDRQKRFIERNMSQLETEAESEDALELDVGKFLDAQLKDYGEVAKMFGVGGDDRGTKKSVSDSPASDGSTSDDLTDPKNNPQIPQ